MFAGNLNDVVLNKALPAIVQGIFFHAALMKSLRSGHHVSIAPRLKKLTRPSKVFDGSCDSCKFVAHCGEPVTTGFLSHNITEIVFTYESLNASTLELETVPSKIGEPG